MRNQGPPSCGVGIAVALLLAAAPVWASAPAEPEPSNPLCWNAPRRFVPDEPTQEMFLRHFDEAVSIGAVEAGISPEGKANPGGYYAFDSGTGPAPAGGTEASIRIFVERPKLIEIRFSGIHGLSEIGWVGDALLRMTVWLGRIAGVEAIFDVEQGRFLARRPFYDGSMLLQQTRDSCRAMPDEPICRPACLPLVAAADEDPDAAEAGAP